MADEKMGFKKETFAAVTVLLGPSVVVPVLVLFLVKKDQFVRYWAMQAAVGAVLFYALLSVVGIILTGTILIVWINSLIWIVGFILWLIFMYKAWQGDLWEAPWIGDLSKKLLARMKSK